MRVIQITVPARHALARAWRPLAVLAVAVSFGVGCFGAWQSNATADDLDATRATASTDRAAAAVLGQSVDDLRAQVQGLGGEPVAPPASDQLAALPTATVTGDAGRDGRDGQVLIVTPPAVTLSAPAGRDGRNGVDGTPGANGTAGSNGANGAAGAPGANATSTVFATTTVTPAPIVLTATEFATVTSTVTSTEYSTVTATETQTSTVTVTAPPDPPTDPSTDPGGTVPSGEPTGAP